MFVARSRLIARFGFATAALLIASAALALAPAESYAKRIVHDASGACIGPDDGDGDAARLILHGAPACANPQQTRLDFGYVSGLLIHRQTQQCIRPLVGGVSAGSIGEDTPLVPLVLADCSKRDHALRFVIDADNLLTHSGGACIAEHDSQAVLTPDCSDRKRIKYALVDLNPRVLAQRPLQHGNIVHRISGLCVSTTRYRDAQGRDLSHFALGRECHKYALLGNDALKHMETGACVYPTERGAMRLHDSCDIEEVRFRYLDSGALQSRARNTCIHPQGGAQRPAAGTTLVMHRDCDASARIAFDFAD